MDKDNENNEYDGGFFKKVLFAHHTKDSKKNQSRAISKFLLF